MCTVPPWSVDAHEMGKNEGNFMKLIVTVYPFDLVMHMKRKKKMREFLGTYYRCHLGLVMFMKWKRMEGIS